MLKPKHLGHKPKHLGQVQYEAKILRPEYLGQFQSSIPIMKQKYQIDTGQFPEFE